MKKRKRILTKLSLFFVMALLCIISFVVPTKAYYSDEYGNLVSQNLISNELDYDVENETFNSYYIAHVYTLNDYISQNGSYSFSIAFEQSLENNCAIELRRNDVFINASLSTELNGILSIIDISIDLSNTYYIRVFATYQTGATKSIRFYNSMLNCGSSALNYEPYGTFYSQTNYDNYGSSQYSQGYTDGYNSIYNNLVDVNLSNQINGFGMGIYDSTGETFVQRASISSSGVENNYYYINFNSMSNNYYVVNIGFNDSYLITSFSIQTAMVSNPSLEANGNMLGVSSNYGYNGSTYGWHNISFSEPVNLVTFRFQNTRDIAELKFYINGKRLNVLDALESYQEGLDNGKEIGYNNGYSQGYAQGSKDNTEITSSGFKVLFNSILSYPVNFFKTVFNFEFMGINIAGLITFIISLVIVGFIWNKFRK